MIPRRIFFSVEVAINFYMFSLFMKRLYLKRYKADWLLCLDPTLTSIKFPICIYIWNDFSIRPLHVKHTSMQYNFEIRYALYLYFHLFSMILQAVEFSKLVGSLRTEESEDVIVSACQKLIGIFHQRPEQKIVFVTQHGLLPLTDLLEVPKTRVCFTNVHLDTSFEFLLLMGIAENLVKGR